MSTTVYINDVPGLDGGLTVQVEGTTIRTNLPKPNTHWTYTDAAGHFHAYNQRQGDDPYPTLDARTEHRDCDGAHTYPIADCDGYDVTRHFCRICGEEIEPGMVPGPHSKTVPGRTRWWAETRIPADQVLEMVGQQVSVRVESDDGLSFGVAVVGDLTIASDDPYTTVQLEGISPLGMWPSVPART
jgi:hypothetical protein